MDHVRDLLTAAADTVGWQIDLDQLPVTCAQVPTDVLTLIEASAAHLGALAGQRVLDEAAASIRTVMDGSDGADPRDVDWHARLLTTVLDLADARRHHLDRTRRRLTAALRGLESEGATWPPDPPPQPAPEPVPEPSPVLACWKPSSPSACIPCPPAIPPRRLSSTPRWTATGRSPSPSIPTTTSPPRSTCSTAGCSPGLPPSRRAPRTLSSSPPPLMRCPPPTRATTGPATASRTSSRTGNGSGDRPNRRCLGMRATGRARRQSSGCVPSVVAPRAPRHTWTPYLDTPTCIQRRQSADRRAGRADTTPRGAARRNRLDQLGMHTGQSDPPAAVDTRCR